MNTKKIRNLKLQRNNIDAQLAVMATGKWSIKPGMVFVSPTGRNRTVVRVSDTLVGKTITYISGNTVRECSLGNFTRNQAVAKVRG